MATKITLPVGIQIAGEWHEVGEVEIPISLQSSKPSVAYRGGITVTTNSPRGADVPDAVRRGQLQPHQH